MFIRIARLIIMRIRATATNNSLVRVQSDTQAKAAHNTSDEENGSTERN